MKDINDWQEAVGLPVISRKKSFQWNLDELEEKLRSSIKKCGLECLSANNGKILTALSGGLDSSLCLALIREEFGYKIPIESFTIGESEKFPDIQHARIVAKKFQTIHHELIPSKTEIEGAKLTKKIVPALFQGESGKLEGIGVFLLIQFIWALMQDKPTTVIFHDGIDELMGGYWEHRKHPSKNKTEKAFKELWNQLEGRHLTPLTRKTSCHRITPIFPYLQREVVEYISKIPVEERTSREESKIPLRRIAQKYLPEEIIRRPKIGFCDALKGGSYAS